MSNIAENCVSGHQLAGVDGGCESQLMPSLKRLNSVLSWWISRHRQRKQLARLEPRLLRDIGLTREQVRQEVSRPFWR